MCVVRDLLKDTHTNGVKSTSDHVSQTATETIGNGDKR